MCTNQRFIYNPYSRNKVLVKCGKCAACLQEKACGRANRMRNNVLAGQIGLFVTLTFDNNSVPYIKRSEVFKYHNQLPIYRNKKVIDFLPLYEPLASDCLSGALDLKKLPDCIGVCYYKDIQKFIKRLRTNLKDTTIMKNTSLILPAQSMAAIHSVRMLTSNYSFHEKMKSCSALPLLRLGRMLIKVERISTLKSQKTVPLISRHMLIAILVYLRCCKTLCLGRNTLIAKALVYLQIALVSLRYFRKSNQEICSIIVNRNMMERPPLMLTRFPHTLLIDTSLNIKDLVGSPLQLRSILLRPERSGDVLTDFSFRWHYGKWSIPITRQCKLIHPLYSYTPNETYRIYVSLENAYQRVSKALGINRFDYALLYERVWSLLSLTCLRLSLQGVLLPEDWKDFYSNGAEIVQNPDIASTLTDIVPLEKIQTDPNKLRDVVEKTSRFSDLFSKLDKRRKVTNLVMAHEGYNV